MRCCHISGDEDCKSVRRGLPRKSPLWGICFGCDGEMALRCPSCGFENLDSAKYCERCGKRLIDGMEPIATARPPKDSPLYLAPVAWTVAVVLQCLGFILYVYYFEGYLSGHYGHLYDYDQIMKAQRYSYGLGELAAALGLLFIVQAVMADPFRTNPLTHIPKARLVLVKWMLISTAIILVVYLFALLNETDIGFNIGLELTWRMTLYLPQLAWLVAQAAVLVFSLALRDGQRSDGRTLLREDR